jgi:hypothetical protein
VAGKPHRERLTGKLIRGFKGKYKTDITEIDCGAGKWIKLPRGAIAQEVGRRLLTAATRVRFPTVHMGFVVDKGISGHVFSKSFGLARKFPFRQMLHFSYPSSGTGTTVPLATQVLKEIYTIIL